MLKGLWCCFLKNLDAMEKELRCLCSKKQKKKACSKCEKKESCFPLNDCTFEEENCRCDKDKEKCNLFL